MDASTHNELPYDRSDPESIVEYANFLIGKSLREATGIGDLDGIAERKGSLGNAVELHYFKYDPNSDPDPDFKEADIELKTTPLKRNKKGELVAKERLVLCMINYMEVINETWETSTVLKKSNRLLLLSYIHEPNVNPADLTFQLAELWKIPKDDLPTIQKDWETIVSKVRQGRAHEISGGDTLYLEACTKSSNSKVRRPQPFSDIPAKPRAWAFKQSYMSTVLTELLNAQKIVRDDGEQALSLIDLVKQRFEKYFGLTEDELGHTFGLIGESKRKPKNLCALITKRILGVDPESKILEFEKAGIKPKTMRIKSNGMPKESISLPVFDYCNLVETDFEDSDFLGHLEQKYLFVIYRENPDVRNEYRLDSVMFWQMPDDDIPEAEECYNEMRKRVADGRADESVKSTENRCCHVRPHGRNSNDTLMTPYGVPVVKKCFWLNASYIGAEIQRLINEDH